MHEYSIDPSEIAHAAPEENDRREVIIFFLIQMQLPIHSLIPSIAKVID